MRPPLFPINVAAASVLVRPSVVRAARNQQCGRERETNRGGPLIALAPISPIGIRVVYPGTASALCNLPAERGLRDVSTDLVSCVAVIHRYVQGLSYLRLIGAVEARSAGTVGGR